MLLFTAYTLIRAVQAFDCFPDFGVPLLCDLPDIVLAHLHSYLDMSSDRTAGQQAAVVLSWPVYVFAAT